MELAHAVLEACQDNQWNAEWMDCIDHPFACPMLGSEPFVDVVDQMEGNVIMKRTQRSLPWLGGVKKRLPHMIIDLIVLRKFAVK